MRINFEPSVLHHKPVILIRFPYHPSITERVKKLVGAKWSATHRCWYVTDNAYYRQRFKLPEKTTVNPLPGVHNINRPAFERFVETIVLKGYSPNTLKTYRTEFGQFLVYLNEAPAGQCTPEFLRRYFAYCLSTLRLSENQVHSRYNAIKFYYDVVLQREKLFLTIPRPKKPMLLPKVLHPADIADLFRNTPNLKHNTMLKLCYGMGLRVSEIINLRIRDIDSKRMLVLISQSKGKKDRMVPLPLSILSQLRGYFRQYQPKEFLFEGQYGGRYSTRSAQQIFYNALKKAGINKSVGIHALRHSYATHLLEAGTDISFIQKLLGHNNIKTTLGYTRITNKNLAQVQSPLDRM